jgi:hypothetical protein
MNETYEATHLTPSDVLAHEALQRLMDLMNENEVSHCTVSVEWVVCPADGEEREIIEKASIDIQIDDLNEAEIEGDIRTTRTASIK